MRDDAQTAFGKEALRIGGVEAKQERLADLFQPAGDLLPAVSARVAVDKLWSA